MTPDVHPVPGAGETPAINSPGLRLVDDARLRDALKRCPPATIEAACAFRQTRDLAQVPAIVRGVIARFVERENRNILEGPCDALRLVEDLGLDSLTMMEVVMLAEDVFPIAINNDELRGLRTVGDVERFIDCKLRGVPPVPTTPRACACLDAVAPVIGVSPPPPPAAADPAAFG